MGFFCTLLLIGFLASPILTKDVCNSKAVLVKTDEFFLTQPYVKEINVNFDDFNSALIQLDKEALKFKTIAQAYDTMEELKAAEPKPLIPYTQEYNLIKIKSTPTSVTKDCAMADARVLELEPEMRPRIQEILKENDMRSTPFYGLFSKNNLLSLKGTYFEPAPQPSSALDSQRYPALTKENVIEYSLTTTTSTTTTLAPGATASPSLAEVKIDGLCMKKNNFWDLEKNRNAWLSLITKIIKTLPHLAEWKNIFTNFASKAKSITNHNRGGESKLPYKLSLPSSFRNILKFITNYADVTKWEQSKASDIDNFTGYMENFKSLIRFFKLNIKKKTIDNTTEISQAELPVVEVDQAKMQKYLEMDPAKFNLAGPISLTSLSKDSDSSEIVRTEANMKIIDMQDLITVYAVRPLIYNQQITTVKYVVKTHRSTIAFQNKPQLQDCSNTQVNNIEIKTCKGFITSGIEEVPPQLSLSCGSAILTDGEATEFLKCPLTKAPIEPLAYRTNCNDYSAVISSLVPLRARVYCDTFLKSTLDLLNFPAYLNTDCEIKILDGEAERVLLSQLHSDFLQDTYDVKVRMPPLPTTPLATKFVLSPTVLTMIIAFPVGFITLLLTLGCILYLFDPEKCKIAMRKICCCMGCLQNKPRCCDCCAPSENIQYDGDEEMVEVRVLRPRSKVREPSRQIQYPTRDRSANNSEASIATAPPLSEYDPFISKSLSKLPSTKSMENVSTRNPAQTRAIKHSYRDQ